MEKSEESCMPPYPTLDGIPIEEWLALERCKRIKEQIDIPDPFSCCEVPESVLGCMHFQ